VLAIARGRLYNIRKEQVYKTPDFSGYTDNEEGGFYAGSDF
jgi:hypothetical protein